MDFNPNVGGLFGGGTPFLLQDENGDVLGEVFDQSNRNNPGLLHLSGYPLLYPMEISAISKCNFFVKPMLISSLF